MTMTIMNSSFVFFALFALLFSLANAEVTGKIESCSGWTLNRLPLLRSFLKDGEAEFYHGVTVKYIPGRQAVLTIYENGVERETVTLSDIPTKVEMHQLMLDKGFIMKDEKVLKQIAEEKRILQEIEDYHTYRRSMFFKQQREMVARFKNEVIYGGNPPDESKKPKQSRLGREEDYLVDNYDKMNAEEKAISTAKLDPEKALADYRATMGENMNRFVQRKVAALKKDAAKQGREEL